MADSIVYVVPWTEYERGWGSRPDGYSVHSTKELAEKYVNDTCGDRSGPVPDEYSSPSSLPVGVHASEVLVSMLERHNGTMRFWSGKCKVYTDEAGTRRISLTSE